MSLVDPCVYSLDQLYTQGTQMRVSSSAFIDYPIYYSTATLFVLFSPLQSCSSEQLRVVVNAYKVIRMKY